MQKLRTLAAFFLVEKQWPEKEERKKEEKQAEAELCQAQQKLGLTIGVNFHLPID